MEITIKNFIFQPILQEFSQITNFVGFSKVFWDHKFQKFSEITNFVGWSGTLSHRIQYPSPRGSGSTWHDSCI